MAHASTPPRHFGSIAGVIALLEQEVVAGELRDKFQLDGFEYLWTEDGTLFPSITSPFSSPYLYRGQTKRYRPCLPGAFRGLPLVKHPRELPSVQRARCFADRVRLEEFALALDSHPASAFAREIGLRMHPIALAQHYGLATDRIDLTQDHMVAAFFATNKLAGDGWSPLVDGVGVLYRLNLTAFHRHFQDRLECIGKQALPRPGEQKAFTLTLPLGVDFETLPLETFTFDQSEACGRWFNDRFDGGAVLFPPDVMGDLASAIQAELTLPQRLVTSLIDRNRSANELVGDGIEEISTLLEQEAQIRVSNREPVHMTSAQWASAHLAVEAMCSTFLRGVGALAVRKSTS